MKKNETGENMGFLGWLTLLFVGLKLTGYIGWSWLWVLSPIWIPVVIVLVFAFIWVVIEVMSK